MKISQDLILGVAIGAAAVLVISQMSKSATPAPPKKPTLPTPGQRPSLPQNSLYGWQRIGIRPWDTPWSQARPQHV